MHLRSFLPLSALALCVPAALSAQVPLLPHAAPAAVNTPRLHLALLETPAGVAASLPDAPGESSSLASAPDRLLQEKTAPDSVPQPPAVPRHSSPTDMTVAPGQVGAPQTVHDKLVGSLLDSVSPFTLAGEVISASYSHLTNGSPNYGTNSSAYGQRVGASFARGTSQNLFYEGVMASVLHEDPRYYMLGNGNSLVKRVVYAGTRPLITRTDSGRTTPNFAQLSAYLGAAYLTRTYYPTLNQSNVEVFKTFGNSLGGAAIGYVVSEFLPGTLSALHLKHLVHP